MFAFQFQFAHFILGTDCASFFANLVMASATLAPEYCIPTSATERPWATEKRDAEISVSYYTSR